MTDTLHKALNAISRLKSYIKEKNLHVAEPIAIVGLSCRLPEVDNKNDFWQLLATGKDIIADMPAERWRLLEHTHESALQENLIDCKGGYLKQIDLFDAYFFGITPREATRMDPQQRLLMEVAYEAIEDAGLPVEALAGTNTGVFASLYASQFPYLQQLETDMDALYIPTGSATSIAANRLSYFYDLRGPSMVIDTACSSSLIALHLARLNLQAKLCDIAIVCAANINFSPSIHDILKKAKMLSPDGICKTFDANANGYVQGEGAGVLVLKPLTKALADRDRIYAVIAGSSSNQDGKSNGLTAPNGAQQEQLINNACRSAGLEPAQLSYVECHGTGTFLGDPIEVEALGNAISSNRSQNNPCWIGSVKTNIGHLEPAAGVISVIKVALALKHKQIPPHLHFSLPNPHIDFAKYHLQVPVQLQAWPSYGEYRAAGISGFGFGGSNAHIIMRELLVTENNYLEQVKEDSHEQLFLLSAKDVTALMVLITRWHDFIKENPTLTLTQICYNAMFRRSHYQYRIAIIASSIDDLVAKLIEVTNNKIHSNKIFTNVNNEKINVTNDVNIAITLAIDYVKGKKINWSEHYSVNNFTYVDLPNYPWQKKVYWPALKMQQADNRTPVIYPFFKSKINSPLSEQQFEFVLSAKVMPEIADTFNFLHAGYYFEMLAYAVFDLTNQEKFSVANLKFNAPIFVPAEREVTIHLILDKNDNEELSFEFFSCTADNMWVEHAMGNLKLALNVPIAYEEVNAIKNYCVNHGSRRDFINCVLAMGMPCSGSIAWTNEFWFSAHEIICELKNVDFDKLGDKFNLNMHLGIIDNCVQSLFPLLSNELIKPYVASSIEKINFYGAQVTPLYVHANLKTINENCSQFTGDFNLIDANGKIVLQCTNLTMTLLNANVQLNRVATSTSRKKSNKNEQEIVEYLQNQVAVLFSMPVADININRSLREMGLDSLMAIVLASAIESDLGVTYSMQRLLKGPSISEIANFIVPGESKQNIQLFTDISNINSELWLVNFQRKPNAKIRLFCFPYGGGGASIYSKWNKLLPDNIEVCAIQLPGRENRMDESSIAELPILIDLLIENLRNKLDLPFAFFGHSFGALIAFELTRALRRLQMPQPRYLFSSAFPDPLIPSRSLEKLIAQLKGIHLDLFALVETAKIQTLSDDTLEKLADIFSANGLVEYGNQMLNKEIVKVLLPIFIADMCIVKGYEYYAEAPLDLPIAVYAGKADEWVSYADQLGWAMHTQKSCEFTVFAGGHLFIRDEATLKILLDKVAACLSATLPEPASYNISQVI